MSGPRVFLCAGEASGDALGASLLLELSRRAPELEAFGMGGPAMKAAGFRALHGIEELGVVGLLEVLRHLPRLFGLVRDLAEQAIALRPDVAVLIDVPDFNLRLARRLAAAGIPVIFYVGPSVWAWRSGRVAAFRRVATKMLVLFPFEVEVWRQAGVDVSCVGHPLLDEIPTKAVARRPRTVALLPGSRRSEVKRHLSILLEAAQRLRDRGKADRFVIPVAPSLDAGELQRLVDQASVASAVELISSGVDPEPRRTAVQEASVALVASGTATLETALLGTPQVILYRVNALSYWLGRLLTKIRFLGLPNLISGRGIVPELLQSDLSPERLSAAAEDVLSNPVPQASALLELRERLGPGGASAKAADLVMEVLSRRLLPASAPARSEPGSPR